MLSSATLTNQVAMNKKMRVDEENKVTERRKVNLRRVLQKGVNFLDALQTEQTFFFFLNSLGLYHPQS